jgi:hypothetical protein
MFYRNRKLMMCTITQNVLQKYLKYDQMADCRKHTEESSGTIIKALLYLE